VPTSTHRNSDHGLTLLHGAGAVLGVLLVAMLVFALTQERAPSPYDASLPNPMGGPTALAPGEATGAVSVAGLEVQGAEIAMGMVPLNITVVPTWTVHNPTAQALSFVTGMPQVLEGCCPGPVFADGRELAPGQTVDVPASASVELAFPLQMHPGMDGYHHLAIPLADPDGRETAALQVTGDFLAGATL
jgi:hypothetical protein